MNICIVTETLSDGSDVFNVRLDDSHGQSLTLNAIGQLAATDLACALYRLLDIHTVNEPKWANE